MISRFINFVDLKILFTLFSHVLAYKKRNWIETAFARKLMDSMKNSFTWKAHLILAKVQTANYV